MKNLFFTIACIILLFTSCKSKEEYMVEGKIKGTTSATLFVVKQSIGLENKQLVDTVRISKDGHFSFRGESSEMTSLIIYLNEGIVWATIWAKNKDKIVVSGDAQYPELITAEGNTVNDLLATFKRENSQLLREKREINDKHQSARALADSIHSILNDTEYRAKLSNINHQLKEKAEDFIAKHPNSVASLVLIQDFLAGIDEPQHIRQHLALITGEIIQTDLYKKLSELNQKILQTAVHSKAPDFTLVSTTKDSIRLSSFHSKYFLLTFSASWCEPCKNETEGLAKLRKKYLSSQLGMLTISLDEDSAEWKESMKGQQLGWPQVLDTYGWNSSMASLYNITAVPSNLLMDTNKIILGRDLSPDSIISVLNQK